MEVMVMVAEDTVAAITHHADMAAVAITIHADTEMVVTIITGTTIMVPTADRTITDTIMETIIKQQRQQLKLSTLRPRPMSHLS
jgi:hypothetical protein